MTTLLKYKNLLISAGLLVLQLLVFTTSDLFGGLFLILLLLAFGSFLFGIRAIKFDNTKVAGSLIILINIMSGLLYLFALGISGVNF